VRTGFITTITTPFSRGAMLAISANVCMRQDIMLALANLTRPFQIERQRNGKEGTRQHTLKVLIQSKLPC
jgi:hypothetical protein